MKAISSILLCALMACGGGNQNTSTANTSTTATTDDSPTGEGVPCTQEVALVCPDGQIDACSKALADNDSAGAQPEDESGGTGTAMALDEGRMSKLERAGTHKCVAQ